MGKRIDKLINKMSIDGIDVFVATRYSDIRYLSNFTGEEGTTVLIISEKKKYLITDGRYISQAKQESESFEVILYHSQIGLFGQACLLLKDLCIKNIVVDMKAISHADYLSLSGNGKLNIEDAKSYLADMRKIKDEKEIESIRKACNISDVAFGAVLNVIKSGMTEIDIVSELEYQFFKNGGDGIAFPTIVASGPVNGTNCHATPTFRKIIKGDLITMDFGCTYEGYCSDITRTIAIGDPDPKLVEIYRIVKQAKADALAVLKAGVTLKEIDAACKKIISANGHTIPHGIGHSFGYDIHEAPFISPRVDYAMECNIVHTLEPGIYIQGLGGIRIEDDYLIKEDGAEQLTHCCDDLIIL